MKTIIRKIVLLFLPLLAVLGCTERIEVELDETYTRLVVEGSISTDTMTYRVSLSKSSDYFSNVPAPRVVNALVTLSDGANRFELAESQPGISGIYETPAGFTGITGKTYTLDIELDEEIGNHKSYSSSCQLVPVTHLDSIQVGFQPDWGEKGFWEIRVFAQEPGNETNYYMFNLYRNDTLVTDSIFKISFTDDMFINGNYINGAAAIYLNNENYWETLREGDKVTLRMSGITKEYYDFLYQVQISGFNLPFFSPPPANIKGNIDNGGIGFFSAFSSTWATTVVR